MMPPGLPSRLVKVLNVDQSYASGFDFCCGFLDNLSEHPARIKQKRPDGFSPPGRLLTAES